MRRMLVMRVTCIMQAVRVELHDKMSAICAGSDGSLTFRPCHPQKGTGIEGPLENQSGCTTSAVFERPEGASLPHRGHRLSSLISGWVRTDLVCELLILGDCHIHRSAMIHV